MEQQQQQQPEPGGSALYRVKVYKLDADGTWLDRGTGQISVTLLEQSEAMGMIIVSEEEDHKTLLVHRITPEEQYQIQEGTILCWPDQEIGTDIAISFEQAKGCEAIWSQLKEAQEAAAQPEAQVQEEQDVPDYPYEQGLPAPDMSNLEDYARNICCIPNVYKERLASHMLGPEWIPALLDVFKQCEDLESMESLALLYRIVRGAIMLNDATLIQELLKEEFVMDVIGALEYDPDLSKPQRHREFLNSRVAFKEVVPIKDPVVLGKIHQTYRIQYIKDVILPRSLDDATYATLSSLSLFNNVEVVSALARDQDFLSLLFVSLDKADPGGEEWTDLVAFLQEFCNLARHLPQTARQQLFNKLVQLGLYEQITRILRIGNESAKLKATDVLLAIVQYDVLALRVFLQTQVDNALLGLLVKEFTEGGSEGGLCEQVAELLKLLLDPETMKEKPEKSEFCDVVYEKFVPKILEVIVTDRGITKEGTRYVPASTLGLVVDFICFCITNHSYRIKYFAVKQKLMQKVMYVLRRPETWLVCYAIRFIRTCIATASSKDVFWMHQIVKNNLLDPVMGVFFANGDRYNLLNSAVLELISFVIDNNLQDLINYLVEQFGHRFDEVDYVETFVKLRQKYEQNKEAANGPQSLADGQPLQEAGGPLRGRTFAFESNGEFGGVRRKGARRWDSRGLSKDEEDYFDTDDGDEEGSSSSGSELGDNLAPLPPSEGPFPRLKRPSTRDEGSPPGSPKRARPMYFASGAPSAKRRAGAGPSLSISIPKSLHLGENQQTSLVGSEGASSQHRTTDVSPPTQVWQGLTEYDDDDDDTDTGQPQQRHQQPGTISDISNIAASPTGPDTRQQQHEQHVSG